MSNHIILIDDDKELTALIKEFLSSHHYHIKIFNNPEKAVTSILNNAHLKCDLIILDIMMPKMSGYMVSNLLAKNNKLKHIPILLLTATSQMAGNIILQTKAQQKLSKPFKPEELLLILKTMLSSNKILN